MSKEEQEEQQNEREEKKPESPDYEAKWKRAVADYRNLEKRVAREKGEFAKFSNLVLISNLLPVLDDLEEAAQKSGEAGFEKILKKLRGVLEEAGLEEIDILGKEFDPEVMECTEVEEGTSEGKQKVVNKVIRKGYNLYNKLLRPARVKVG